MKKEGLHRCQCSPQYDMW